MASRALDLQSQADRWLATPVGGGDPRPVPAAAALAARVRLVLETRPGDLPWNPAFGCALDRFLGNPVTQDRTREIATVVQTALQRWIRGAVVTRCDVRAYTDLGAGPGAASRPVPVAERALVPWSLRSTLEVDLELQTADGPVSLQAILSP